MKALGFTRKKLVDSRGKRSLFNVIGLLFCLVAHPAYGSWFSSAGDSPTDLGLAKNSSLVAAHKAYMEKRWNRSLAKIKETLTQDPTAAERRNALELYDALQKEAGKHFQYDWVLPEVVRRMDVKHRKRVLTHSNETDFQLTLKFRSEHRDLFQQVTVEKYGDRLLFDKEAQIGKWKFEAESGEFAYKAKMRASQPFTEGLYLFHIQLTNGQSTNGWFILADMHIREEPQIISPRPGEIFTTPHPVASWREFRSSSYKSGEKTAVNFEVSRSEPPHYDWEHIWGGYQSTPDFTSLTLGDDSASDEYAELSDGRYVFQMIFYERRWAGAIRMSREVSKNVAFRVRLP